MGSVTASLKVDHPVRHEVRPLVAVAARVADHPRKAVLVFGGTLNVPVAPAVPSGSERAALGHRVRAYVGSVEMVGVAREAARKAGLDVRFVHSLIAEAPLEPSSANIITERQSSTITSRR